MVTTKESTTRPVRERAKDELRECQELTKKLFEAQSRILTTSTRPSESQRPVDASTTKASEPVQIMEKLIQRQQSLRKVVDSVLEHQRLNDVIEELRKANAVEDGKIAHLGANMRTVESVLQNALDEARPRLGALKRANKRPVDVDEVISYGSKISASLAAPPRWDPSQPLGNHLPPAPTDEMMRAGRLAALALQEDNNQAEEDSNQPLI